MPYKRLEQEIEEFCQFLGSFALSAAHSIEVKRIIPYDSGVLRELLNIAEGIYTRHLPQGISLYILKNSSYAASQFAYYLRDERVKPSLLGIFSKPQDIDEVAELSDKLANKINRAIRLMEKKQKSKE